MGKKPLPKEADFIALLSFASTNGRLTNGSRETLARAKELANRYPRLQVFGGSYFDNPRPDVEKEEKIRTLGDQFVWVGPVSSTTDEYAAILSEVRNRNLNTGTVIVVDESFHSIRARIVWRHYLPKSTLSFQLVPGTICADSENPMPLQRHALTWLLANLLFAPLFKWWPGVDWWEKKNFNQSFKDIH